MLYTAHAWPESSRRPALACTATQSCRLQCRAAFLVNRPLSTWQGCTHAFQYLRHPHLIGRLHFMITSLYRWCSPFPPIRPHCVGHLRYHPPPPEDSHSSSSSSPPLPPPLYLRKLITTSGRTPPRPRLVQSPGTRLPQRHAWIMDEASESGLSRANRQSIPCDMSFVAWPVRLHRKSRSTNRYCSQTRTTTLVAWYHLALSSLGKGQSAQVSKEVVSGPEAIAEDPVMSIPRRIVLEAKQRKLVGSQPPRTAGSVKSDGRGVHSCIPCRGQAPCEENLAV